MFQMRDTLTASKLQLNKRKVNLNFSPSAAEKKQFFTIYLFGMRREGEAFRQTSSLDSRRSHSKKRNAHKSQKTLQIRRLRGGR